MQSGFDLSDMLLFLPVLLAASALAFVMRATRTRRPPPLSRRERIQRRRELAGLPPEWSPRQSRPAAREPDDRNPPRT
jgi:hypothetical protein